MLRREVLKLGIGGALASASGSSAAQAQLAGTPLKIIFPFGAGGGGDALSRIVAEQIGPALGRSIIVENRTGADGRIGIQAVKAAPPDGDTLLITTGPTMWLMAMVHPAPGYDPFADFEPVSQLAAFEFCIAVANTLNVKTLPELVAWIKANPDKATYGIPGAGTIPHFTGVSFAKSVGVDMKRLPYRGGAPAINDLVGGQIPIVIGTLVDALQQHRGGTVRIVAVTSKARSAFVPDVPTLSESGIDLVGDAWYGLWAPARTPRETVAKINAAVAAGLAKPEVKQRLETLGLIAMGTPPAALTAAMKDNTERWGPIIKASGYTMQQ
jgi:tripartite-type tricarboxylate transporter receptor subunit TctC